MCLWCECGGAECIGKNRNNGNKMLNTLLSPLFTYISTCICACRSIQINAIHINV